MKYNGGLRCQGKAGFKLKVIDVNKGLLDIEEIDELFELRRARRFAFGSEVAQVFDDMVSRSVPGYLEGQLLAGSIASKYYKPNSSIVDIGCATGTTLALIWKRLSELQPDLLGIDSSEAMLDKARQKFRRLKIDGKIALTREPIEEIDLPKSSVVISQYTLQFLSVEAREKVIQKVASTLIPGGAFLLSEKIRIVERSDAELMRDLYEDFKRMNGYSDIEIARKREALKGVLVPISSAQYQEMLIDAGFKRVVPVMQGYQFSSWLCLA